MSEQEVAKYNENVQEWWNSLEDQVHWEIYQFVTKLAPKSKKFIQDREDKKFEERLTTCTKCGVTFDQGFSEECPHEVDWNNFR